MRTLPSAVADSFAARRGRVARLLIWIEAKNRDTGLTEALGLWTGADHQEFIIGGEVRTYYGGGGLMSMDPLTSDIGLTVREVQVSLSPNVDEVNQVIRGWEPRLAPIEVHVADFDPDTRKLLAAPTRVFRGWIDQAPITDPAPGGEAICNLTLLSSAYSLTRSLPRKVSDETLRARASGDGLRKYADVSGSVECVWGEKRAAAPSSTTASTTLETPGDRR